MSIETKQCRRALCDEEAMHYGRYDWTIVAGMDKMYRTTTDPTLCGSCNYWLSQSGRPGIIVDKNGVLQHYNLGPEDAPKMLRGFDGTRVRITVTDCARNRSIFGPNCGGVTRESTNMWSQGEVPQRFVTMMQNDAAKIFVKIEWLGRW